MCYAKHEHGGSTRANEDASLGQFDADQSRVAYLATWRWKDGPTTKIVKPTKGFSMMLVGFGMVKYGQILFHVMVF